MLLRRELLITSKYFYHNSRYYCCEQYIVNRVINFVLYVNFRHIVGLILENLY